jgi:hypothetical protein
MPPFRLARIAAEAESVRLRAMASRLITQLIVAIIALYFLFGAAVFAHIAAWYWLRGALNQSQTAAAGILCGIDLLLGIGVGFMARRTRPSATEIEASAIRTTALQGMGHTSSLIQLSLSLISLLANLRRRKPD